RLERCKSRQSQCRPKLVVYPIVDGHHGLRHPLTQREKILYRINILREQAVGVRTKAVGKDISANKLTLGAAAVLDVMTTSWDPGHHSVLHCQGTATWRRSLCGKTATWSVGVEKSTLLAPIWFRIRLI